MTVPQLPHSQARVLVGMAKGFLNTGNGLTDFVALPLGQRPKLI
jgi:hypothetical protein